MTEHRGLSRRESLRRAGLLGLGGALPFSFAACAEQNIVPWHIAELPPIDAPGYGTDPDLLHPAPAPWPRTLTDRQRDTFAALADLLIPAEGQWPAATEVGVVDVLDEWVSAPYPEQQEDRKVLLAGIDWCDATARQHFGVAFKNAAQHDQLELIEPIANGDTAAASQHPGPTAFFVRIRELTTGAYYTSPAGVRELGYQGNTPIAGSYPGPTAEAMAHLNEQLTELGLSLPPT